MYMTMKKGIQLFYKKMCTFKVSGEFRFDLNENWNKLDVLSVEDKLIGLEYVLISKYFLFLVLHKHCSGNQKGAL